MAVLDKGEEQRPVWLGSATFDDGIGFSHYTGAVTHRIAPDIDAQRDGLIGDLTRANMLEATYLVYGIGPTSGAAMARATAITPMARSRSAGWSRKASPPPRAAENPISLAVALKLAIWRQMRGLVVD